MSNLETQGPGILVYPLYTKYVPLRVPRIPRKRPKGLRTHIRGPYPKP